ncbi:hypothetical protein BD769DRAFT_1495538 [Suillus cothurnatus]|nr:hypothetical protein BD769DRAFT_1495538 [Suillus cothurnatus]
MKSLTFGFDRRVCPGKHLAENSMYMGLALLFWSFRIDQRPDCPINTRASDSVVSHIAPFEIDIIPWLGMQVCFEDVVLLLLSFATVYH